MRCINGSQLLALFGFNVRYVFVQVFDLNVLPATYFCGAIFLISLRIDIHDRIRQHLVPIFALKGLYVLSESIHLHLNVISGVHLYSALPSFHFHLN